MSKVKSQPTIEEDLGDIDEDPFSHFLSPVLDDEDPFEDAEFTAGISPFEEEIEAKRTKFRVRLGQRWDSLLSRRPGSPKQRSRPCTPPEDQVPDLMNDEMDAFKSPEGSPPASSVLDDELDGWEADRARQRRTFGFPLQRPRLKTSRTLSGRKHSWTEPSPQLFTVDEDDETDTIRPTSRGRRRSR